MKSVQFIFHYIVNKPFIKAVIFLLIPLFSIGSNGLSTSESYITTLSAEITHAKNDSIKIENLYKLAFYYFDVQSDHRKADSISRQAISIAEASYRPGLLLLGYIRHIESCDPAANFTNSLRYATEAVRLSKLVNSRELEWRSYGNLVKVYLSRYMHDNALGGSFQALALADAMGNDALKAESYLLIGQSLEGNNQKIEAFRNYLNANTLAEKIKNTRLLKKCYSLLSGFYNNSNIYDKAILYKLRQQDLVLNESPVDSVQLVWIIYDLQVINLNSDRERMNSKSMQQVFDFAQRHDHIRLRNFEIALYRTHLIENENIDLLYKLYTQQFPEEFERLAIENPVLYFRLSAFFKEEEKKTDSAYYFMVQAEKNIQLDPNKIFQSNFYQRFGQFLVRQGENKQAIEKFKKAFDLAGEASYFQYMLSASKDLELLYSEMGDYKNAYTYSTLNRALNDSINTLTKNDQLLTMEIDHETRQRETAAAHELEETHRRHNIQYSAITIITIAMFIILLMLGSLKVPAWTIKMLGFFSFILFFEFLIMIADHKIYEITHNEPWKILLIKIGLIAFLLPFHHWIEKKVIHFLISQKLITLPKFSIRKLFQSKLTKSQENQA